MKRILTIILVAFCALTLSAAPKKASAKTELVSFNVALHCQNCVKKVTENISFEKGVKDLKCSLEEHTVVILFDPAKTSVEKLQAAITKLGYEATVQNCGGCEGCAGCGKQAECGSGECGKKAECGGKCGEKAEGCQKGDCSGKKCEGVCEKKECGSKCGEKAEKPCCGGAEKK